MADDPLRRKPGRARARSPESRPEIWASGGQRPPFDIRALGRASLHLAREAVAPALAWSARKLRRSAVRVKDGTGRIPAGKLGRAERFLPSHLRVAGWMKNLAATLSHASASADPDVLRGNALVAEIKPHLWLEAAAGPVAPQLDTPPIPAPGPAGPPADVAPVVLPEPTMLSPGDDPLAAIRDEIAAGSNAPESAQNRPDQPPAPPGPAAEGAIQVLGYLIGWASAILALPYGLARALWLWGNGRDLKTIGRED